MSTLNTIYKISSDIASFESGMNQVTASFAKVDASSAKMIAGMSAIGEKSVFSAQMIEKMSQPTQAITTATDSWTASVGKMAAGYVTGMATVEAAKRAIGALVGFVRESIDAAAEAQLIQTKLTAALTNTHQNVATTSQQFAAYAQQLQATTTLEDDAIVSVMALATEMGVSGSEMKRVITIAADLSAAWGISLEEAMSDVVKGGEGMTRAFKAHAIELDETRAKSEGLAYVLPELEKHFNGNAAAQLETYSGRVTALGVAWGNLKEEIGNLVTGGGLATGALQTMSTMVLGFSTMIKDHGVPGMTALAASGTNLWPILLDLGHQAEAAAKHVKTFGDISLDTKASTADLTDWITHLQTAVESLTPQEEQWIRQANALGASEAAIAEHLKKSETAVKVYLDAQKQATEADKLATKGLQDLADAYQKLHVLTMNNDRKVQADLWEMQGVQLKVVNEQIIANFEAQVKLNAAQGLDAAGAIKVETTALETLRIGLENVHRLAVAGIDQKPQEIALYNDFAKSIGGVTAAENDLYLAQLKRNEETAKIPGVAGPAIQSIIAIGTAIQFTIEQAHQWNALMAQGLNTGVPGSVANFGTGSAVANAGTTAAWVANTLSGTRGNGGPVSMGQSYLVGERGPEVYTPGANGFITPRGGAGGGTNISITINGSVLSSKDELARAIADALEHRQRGSAIRMASGA